MECIQNIIGITGCGVPADADNQLFINQLPGVSIQNIEALADGNETEGFLDVWSNIKKRGLIKFALLVKARINKCHRITDNTVIECLVCENVDLFAVALWYLFGAELMIERTSSDTLNRWTTIDLDKAEQLKAEFYTEFAAALDDAVSSLDPAASACTECKDLECNDKVKFVFQTP